MKHIHGSNRSYKLQVMIKFTGGMRRGDSISRQLISATLDEDNTSWTKIDGKYIIILIII